MEEQQWQPWCERPSGLVVPTAIDPTGVSGPTRGQAAGPRFRQTSPGRYVRSTAPELVEQRILEQAHRLHRYGAVTAWASLRWRGAHFFDGHDAAGSVRPVPLVGHKLRPDRRVHLTQDQLAPSEFVVVDGIPCTTVQRALFDEVRRLGSWREAVVAIDMTAAAGLISVRLFAAYVAERPAWTGVPFVRKALPWAIDESRSPQETRMRLVWVEDAGLPPPLCNQPVFDLDGNLLGLPDLFDPAAGCVGEYDGVDHKDGRRHQRDVAREARFRDHGLEYFEVVGGDLRNRAMVAERMRNARARAKFLPPESCAWTLQPPAWYLVPESLDERLIRLGLADSLCST
ncbi:MAG TPA: hypothetical protein VFI99_15340 [Nocardioides sp.]|nr:hypothetical protein [Nocardioides sp.]